MIDVNFFFTGVMYSSESCEKSQILVEILARVKFSILAQKLGIFKF